MLVLPLDLVYDQNGNGLKVEDHGLGLRGVFNQDKAEAIITKITNLLKDKGFKQNLAKFNEEVQSKYPGNFIRHTITKLINNDEPI